MARRRLRDPETPLPAGALLQRTGQLFVSSDFSFPLSPEQSWRIQPGPLRLGKRHPERRCQRTTVISNNQTQLISLPLKFRVPGHRLPDERTRHHPSFCSRPSSPDAFRSRCPTGATATSGRKTKPQPRSATVKYHSFLSSDSYCATDVSLLGRSVIPEGSGR